MTLRMVKSQTDNPKDSSKDKTKRLAGSNASTPGKPFNLVEYFKGVKQEWFKITWPPRPLVIANTGIVIVVVLLFTVFVYLVDMIFSYLTHLITIS